MKAEIMNRLVRMCESMESIEKLSDSELADKLGSLGGDIDSEQSSIIGEVLHRWRHPWKFRLERIKKLCRLG